MITSLLHFAAEEAVAEPAGGIAALGLDAKAFVFQLITFVLVLLFLKKYVFGKLVDTLEERRSAVIGSLEAAKQAAQDLDKAEERVTALINEARKESAGIVATAHKEATAMIEEAEVKARKKAEHIVTDAKTQLDSEVLKARVALQKETRVLIADATEQIIGQKLTGAADEKLIEKALAGAR